MTKIFKYTFLVLVVPSILLVAAQGWAIDVFPLSVMKSASVGLPVFNIPDSVVSGGKLVASTAGNVISTKNAITTNVNNVRNMATSISSGDFGALLDGSLAPGQMGINECGGMSIAQCKMIDFTDVDSIEKAEENYKSSLKTLFLTYPKDDANEDAYKLKRQEFYQDTVVEIYSASTQLEKYLNEDVTATLEEAQKALQEGGSGAPAPDGKVEASYAQAKAYESIDNLLMVLQQAVALKAQLRSAKMIATGIEPISYQERLDEDGENQSSLTDRGDLQFASSAQINETIPLAFAQMMTPKATSAIASVENAALENSSSSQKILREVDGFMAAPESEIFHPYVYEEDKLNELEKITPVAEAVSLAQSAHNTIVDLKTQQSATNGYKDMVAKHKVSLDALKASNQCVIQYLGHHFSNPEIVWSGRPLGDNVASHELRGGISGWAIEAFETAKAAKISPISTEDIVEVSFDDEKMEQFSDVSNIDKTIDMTSNMDTFTANPSKTEQQEKDQREIDMISWQTGAEASKLLLENTSKWGNLNKRFPVWTDTKSFYNQYLDGKYTNIKEYLKIFSAGDIKAMVVAKSNGQDKQANETLKIKDIKALNAEASSENLSILKEGESDLNANQANLKGELDVLELEKKSINDKLDIASQKVQNLSEKISDLRQKIKDDAVDSLQKAVSETDSYDKHYDGLGLIDESKDGVSEKETEGMIKRLQSENKEKQSFNENPLRSHFIFSSQLNIASAFVKADNFEVEYRDKVASSSINDEISGLENELVVAKKEVADLQVELTQIKEKIIHQKMLTQGNVAGLKGKSNSKLSELMEKLQEKRAAKEKQFNEDSNQGLDSIAKRLVAKLESEHTAQNNKDPYSGPTASFLVGGLDKVINIALSDLYEKIDKAVDNARKKLSALGDNLYDPNYHKQVVAIHEQLITDIKALPLNISKTPINAAMTIYLYEQLITAETGTEEEDFFVGNPAKERDLKAPKIILDYNLPPLREIVHFDHIDEQNVIPYVENNTSARNIAASDFLNYGGEIPPIWKLMLKDQAFVEQNFNLKSALNIGCTEIAFLRGGFMPCKIKNSGIVVDVNSSAQLVRAKSTSAKLSFCPYLEYKGNKVYNSLDDTIIPLGDPKTAEDANCSYSELGTLLDADSANAPEIRSRTFKVFYNIIKQQASSGKENDNLTEDERAKLSVYNNAPLAVNQIGNFLKYVENEENYRKQVEELKTQNDEMLANLVALLQKFGFEPSPTFDISNPGDFELARKKLDSFKNQQVGIALAKIGEVNLADNEVAEERISKYKKIVAALQKDNEELTNISDAVIDNNLDEEVKSSKVNNNVSQKYDDEAARAANKSSKMAEQPYCATY